MADTDPEKQAPPAAPAGRLRPSSEEARRALLTAFPASPPPETLFTDNSSHALEAAKSLGRPEWTQVSAADIKSPWYYLTEEGWRYYLPARLKHALDSSDEAWPVSIALAPSMDGVLLYGCDKRLHHRLAGLSDGQYAAATTVLWALMDTTTQTGRWCAKALRWGWTQRPSAALEAALAYYGGLNGHRYLPHPDAAIEALIQDLREAFAEAPYPGDDGIGNNPGHCEECAGYHLELRGYHWDTIHPDVLKVNDAALSFLSPAGLRFFMPAWIIAGLHGQGWNTDPLFHLTYGVCDGNAPESPDDRDGAVRKLAAFSSRERATLAAYLRHRRPEAVGDEAGWIAQSLQRFWEKKG